VQETLAPAIGGWTGYPVGFAAAVVVTSAAVAAHGTAHPLWTLGVLSVTTATVSAFVTLRAALATAAVTWACHAGFVLGRRGELALTPAAAAAAAVLASAAVLGFGVALGVRYARRSVSGPDRSPTSPSFVTTYHGGDRPGASGRWGSRSVRPHVRADV
jgi:hypothetical protein